MRLDWNFQRGGGFKSKKPFMGGVWIFSETTQQKFSFEIMSAQR